MIKRRTLAIAAASAAVVISSLMCELDTRESDQLLESQNLTSVALEATRFSVDLTATAAAQLPPSSTPLPPATETPALPPPSATTAPDAEIGGLDLANLPPALVSHSDPTADVVICETGQQVDDPAADIVSVEIFEASILEIDDGGFMARIGLAAPANETYLLDWSASLLAAVAPQSSSTYTYTLNEIHADVSTVGVIDPSGAGMVSGTEANSFIDDQGFIWVHLGSDLGFLHIQSFHLPSADLPPEEKRCDVAPDESVFVINLP
jgi:hypothetical protein